MKPPVQVLVDLIRWQYAARLRRMATRLRSPRRCVATLLVIVLGLLWLPYFVAASWLRPAADLDSLHRWLSGGLTLYALFHLLRAAWQASEVDLGLTPAQRLWLGCAPVPRWTLVLYRSLVVLVPTFIKAAMLCILLARDTPQPLLAAIAIVAALLTLELVRLFLFTWVAGLSTRGLYAVRVLATGAAIAIALQVFLGSYLQWHGPWNHAAPARLAIGLIASLGDSATDPSIQRLSLPFQPFAILATATHWDGTMWLSLFGCASVLVTTLWLTVVADRHARRGPLERERRDLEAYRRNGSIASPSSETAGVVDHRRPHGVHLPAFPYWKGIGPLAARQWVTLRRYRGMVFVSLVIPGLLSLLPLWLGGMGTGTILDVIGGLTFYTLLLAPPALKMDFRRDIDVLLVLAALPLRPLTMVIGQIAIPVLTTIVFQACVVGLAVCLRPVSLTQAAFWLLTLAGTAVFAFALENALFLTFPHRLKQEGIEMFVRTKLVFIGKGCLWAAMTAILVAWGLWCSRTFPGPYRLPILSAGVLLIVWSLAAATLAIAARAWRRFDLSSDLPA